MADKPKPEIKTVFVISPIGKPGTPEYKTSKTVLDYLIKKTFAAPEWVVVRADDESAPDSITTQVIERIVMSDLIVADLSGHNPNVFYELAVAHGYQRPVIHIMQEGQAVPFDVVDQRVIFYDLTEPSSVEAAKSALAASAQYLGREGTEIRSPLTAHGKFSAISDASPEGANEALVDALQEISFRLSKLESGQRKGERQYNAFRDAESGFVTRHPGGGGSGRGSNVGMRRDIAEEIANLDLRASELAEVVEQVSSAGAETDHLQVELGAIAERRRILLRKLETL